MEYRIKYRIWDNRGLIEDVSEVEACDFEIKKGFVGIWTVFNDTTRPDLYINANDVLTIESL
ncbi:hypothetical protein SAMN05216431_10222 [Ligilactobacillus sp. WC1T17]|uniref:YopX protein domain-containing protein n=1 Tax=Ligilactobacillus ruminis TaxID=1623 RepID=A0ABY1A9E9_9LACO|nr:hypothetical protein SAMN05216431_10222 [Ligilactobacillus ruminis]